MTPVRVEKDSLGTSQIPDGLYYGIQTQRAVENFPISGLRAHPKFLDAFITIKKAAACANLKAGTLKRESAEAMIKACDEILSGALRDQFPVDVFQMGAGTSFNMNVNEVIANRANELLGSPLGSYQPIHPNDHVNMGQSTNDVFPSAMRLSLILMLKQNLYPAMEKLEEAFFAKGEEFNVILKSARTHLQDAVPIRLGQEFTAYAHALRKTRLFLITAEKSLHELGLGGTAAGTGLNASALYRQEVVRELSRICGCSFTQAEDLREAMQSQRGLAELSAALRNCALELIRICNDLRLLSSGPTTGLNEINLPSTAPGSSIMPGKVNPSVLEMTTMVAFQVVGCDSVVALAMQAGQLELNVMMPLMAFNLNFAAMIFSNALVILESKCIRGITANITQCQKYAEASMGLATALNPVIGYARAAELAQEALRSGKTIIEVARERKILSETDLKKILDPFNMTEPR